MRWKAAALAFALIASATAQAGSVRPIIVELYTSQGCSSCPPADALLGRLAQRDGVIALSLPITYWDMFGWKDTLASEANTQRQKAYAAVMRHGGVYTPQIIIDGTRDVVGSREAEVLEVVSEATEARDDAEGETLSLELPAALTSVTSVARQREATAWSVGVGVTGPPQKLRIAVGRAPERLRTGKFDATIWLFRLRSSATVRIMAGENSGRTATYRNVVSDIRDIGHWRGEALSVDLPRADGRTPPHDSLAVIVQQGGYGRVIGAAYLRQATYYAQQ